MDTQITIEQLKHIAGILGCDTLAISKKYEIYGMLGLPDDYLRILNERLFGRECYGNVLFFKDMLRAYRSVIGIKATVRRLRIVFLQLELIRVNKILETEFGELTSTAIGLTFTPNQAVVPVPLAAVGNRIIIDANEFLEHIRHSPGSVLAVTILKMLSFFEPDLDVPAKIFFQLKAHRAPSPDELDEALRMLTTYVMLIGSPGDGVLSVSGIGMGVKVLMTREETLNALDLCLEVLQEYMSQEKVADPLTKSLFPHALLVWKHSMQLDELVRKYGNFPHHLCNYLYKLGGYSRMLQLARDSTPVIQRVLGPNNSIPIFFSQALALSSLRQYQDSIRILNPLYSLAKEKFGDEDLTTLTISLLLAQNFGAQYNYHMQLSILWKVEDHTMKRHITRGQDVTVLLVTIRYNKALALCNMGCYEYALKNIESVQTMQLRDLSARPYNTAYLKTALLKSEILLKLSKFSDALFLFRTIELPLKEMFDDSHMINQKVKRSIDRCRVALKRRK